MSVLSKMPAGREIYVQEEGRELNAKPKASIADHPSPNRQSQHIKKCSGASRIVKD